jgi:hypothetical protein
MFVVLSTIIVHINFLYNQDLFKSLMDMHIESKKNLYDHLIKDINLSYHIKKWDIVEWYDGKK